MGAAAGGRIWIWGQGWGGMKAARFGGSWRARCGWKRWFSRARYVARAAGSADSLGSWLTIPHSMGFGSQPVSHARHLDKERP
jgi:hypothetical protein